MIQGWGGPLLLDSYEQERRPVHEYVMDEAVANHALLPKQMWREGLEDATPAGEGLRGEVGTLIRSSKVREFNTLSVVLGYNYSGSPLVVEDGSAPPARDFRNYVPSAHPGCLAPHAWLGDGASLYDGFGKRFTLLATNGQAEPISRDDVKLLAPKMRGLEDLYGARYALIRPDQHVAWRGNELPDDPASLLRRVSGFPQ